MASESQADDTSFDVEARIKYLATHMAKTEQGIKEAMLAEYGLPAHREPVSASTSPAETAPFPLPAARAGHINPHRKSKMHIPNSIYQTDGSYQTRNSPARKTTGKANDINDLAELYLINRDEASTILARYKSDLAAAKVWFTLNSEDGHLFQEEMERHSDNFTREATEKFCDRLAQIRFLTNARNVAYADVTRAEMVSLLAAVENDFEEAKNLVYAAGANFQTIRVLLGGIRFLAGK